MTTATKTKPVCRDGSMQHRWKLGQQTPDGVKGRCSRCHRTYLFTPEVSSYENYGKTPTPVVPVRVYIESEFLDWNGG